MKKILTSIIAVLLLLCTALFGCGTDPAPVEPTEDPLPDGLVFRAINNRRAYTIYAEDREKVKNLTGVLKLPSYHEGLPVTRLGDGSSDEGWRTCFADCTQLEEVILPENLAMIPRRSFWGAGIQRVTIPKGCTIIGSEAFYNCKNLTEVQLSGGPLEIEDKAFLECSIEKVNLDGLTKIGSSAFPSVDFKQIVIPDSVESIGAGAFGKVLTAMVPSSVRSIEAVLFGCTDIYTDAIGKQAGWESDFDGKLEHFSPIPYPGYYYWIGSCSHVFRGCTFQHDGDTPYVYSMPNQLLNYFDGEFTNKEGKAEDEFVPVRAFSVPFREGYTFKGWSLEEGSREVEFGVTMFDPTTVPELQEAAQDHKFMQEPYLCSLSTVGDWLRFTPDQTLYAVWEKE